MKKRRNIKTRVLSAVTGGWRLTGFKYRTLIANWHRDNEQCRSKVTQEQAKLQEWIHALLDYVHSHWLALMYRPVPQYCNNQVIFQIPPTPSIPQKMLNQRAIKSVTYVSSMEIWYCSLNIDTLKFSPVAFCFNSTMTSELLWNSWQHELYSKHIYSRYLYEWQRY